MKNKDNNNFIYLRSLGRKVPVTAEFHDAFYRETARVRMNEQFHDRCMCPAKSRWKCDGDCPICEYHKPDDHVSLDAPDPEEDGNLYDCLPDPGTPMEEVVADRLLLDRIFDWLREHDPDADTIIRLWKDHPEGISNREIARAIGRPRRTFDRQIKRYRAEFRKIIEN